MTFEWPGIKVRVIAGPVDRILPGDKVFACPSCGSTLPAASCLVLRNWVDRDGAIVGIATGERIACQAIGCGHQYSIGPNGTFKHNPAAQPYTGDAMPQQQPQMQTESQEQRPATPPRPEWPTALPKPRV